jgi:hypothetical protein
MKHPLSILSTAAALALASGQAQAQLTVDNITYSLSQSFASAVGETETWNMTLDIANNSTDGRTGITSLAFTQPMGFVSASLPGWSMLEGGMGASGCNGAGNFFCFSGYAAAAPTMSFSFLVTGVSGGLASYNPSFKVDWVGSMNNYDLVSQPLTGVAPVPEPSTYALMFGGLGLIGVVLRRRRQQG